MEILRQIVGVIFLVWMTICMLGLFINVMMNGLLDGFIKYEEIKAKKLNDTDAVQKIRIQHQKHRKRTLVEAAQWLIWPYYAVRKRGIFAPLY